MLQEQGDSQPGDPEKKAPAKQTEGGETRQRLVATCR